MYRFYRSKLSSKFFLITFLSLNGLLIISSCAVYYLSNNFLAFHLNEDLSRTVTKVRQIVETSASLSVRNYLRGIAEDYVQSAEALHKQFLADTTSLQDAKDSLAESMLAKSIGASGYIYVLDSNGIVKVHPRTGVLGQNVSEHSFVREQISKKKGFIQYLWKNPGEPEERQKVLYMEYFEPWDWIISVSAYKDELPQLIQPSDFQDVILSNEINENGYPFVIKNNGDVLVHPTIQGNVLRDYPLYKELFKKLIDQSEGKIFYDWQEPSDKSEHKKVMLFDTIDDYGWVVAATGYVDEFYHPLRVLKNIFIGVLILGLFVSLLVSYYLSRIITTPLKRLVEELSTKNGDLNPLDAKYPNEVEAISTFCSNYIQELKYKNIQLTQLMEEKEKSAFNLSIFKEVFENIVEGISITDAEGTIVLCNPAFSRITGYLQEEAVGKNPRILKSDRHPASFYENIWKKILEEGYWSGEIWNKRKSGEIYPEWLTITAIKDKDQVITHYAAVFNDISDIIEQQKEIQFLAYYDHLTNLPNRLSVSKKLGEMVSAAIRQGDLVVCLAVDIANFKTFNDSMGHDNGDILLKSFVDRVRPVLREEDLFGRIGGDDFIISFVCKVQDSTAPIRVINRLFQCLQEPFFVAGKSIHLVLQIGVAIFPKDAEYSEELLKNANIALQNTKSSFENSYCFFDEKMEISINKKLHYLEKIREGIKNDEFVPFFQPKVDLVTDQVVGMEALARWKTGDTLVNPGDFIPVAEKSGLIVPISEQIYEKAFLATRELRESGYDLSVSVNLSPAQFEDEDFINNLLSLRKRTGLSTDHIELEITESILFDNSGQTRDVLKTLSSVGFTISIDDFGTGYSSLQYLKKLPLDTLKIDMTFVSGIGIDQNDENLVQTIVLLAKQFGLHIVAEGVEKEAQIEFLKNLGCEQGQGFFYGKPMVAADFKEYLSKRLK